MMTEYFCKAHIVKLGQEAWCPYCYAEEDYAHDMKTRYGCDIELKRLETQGNVIVEVTTPED